MKQTLFEKYFYKFIFNFTSTKKRFTTIYEKNFWSSDESISGPGSNLENTVTIRRVMPEVLKKYEIKSFLDLPCGDFHWMKLIDLDGIKYIGGDIVQKLIEANKLKYGGNENIQFRTIDLIKDSLPPVDMLMVRDCFIHLSNDLVLKSLDNIKRSNIKYLLTNSHPDMQVNKNIKTGTWRRINMSLEPFNLKSPVEVWEETEHFNPKEGKKVTALYKIDEM